MEPKSEVCLFVVFVCLFVPVVLAVVYSYFPISLLVLMCSWFRVFVLCGWVCSIVFMFAVLSDSSMCCLIRIRSFLKYMCVLVYVSLVLLVFVVGHGVSLCCLLVCVCVCNVLDSHWVFFGCSF